MRGRRNLSQVQPIVDNQNANESQKNNPLAVVYKQNQQTEQQTSLKLLESKNQPAFELIPMKTTQTNMHSQSQKAFTEANIQTKRGSQDAINSQGNINNGNLSGADSSNNQLNKDKYMILVLVIGFVSYIGLGLYAIKISNPYQEIKEKYDQDEQTVVNGFFSVIIAFCITLVLGLFLKTLLLKNFQLTMKIAIILSGLILIALVTYSFYINQLALGIISAIGATLIIFIGYSNYKKIPALYAVGQISKSFDFFQGRYIYLLLGMSFLVLISIAFTIIVVTHILFSVYDNPKQQNLINFFAAAYVFLSYWINNTLISFYSFVISRHVSQSFFIKNIQLNETRNTAVNIHSEQQNTNLMSMANDKNILISSDNQPPSLNSGDSNIENLQLFDQTSKLININSKRTSLPTNSNTTPHNNNSPTKQSKDCENIENLIHKSNNKDQQSNKINPMNDGRTQPQSNACSIILNQTSQLKIESLKTTFKIGLKQLGSIAYCSLISQIIECIFFGITLLIYGSGMVLMLSSTLTVVREALIKVNGYLSIIRIAHDSSDYCSSLSLVSKQLQKKNYLFAVALYYSNTISQTLEFFCFITGFATGVVLIVLIDYNYWFIIFVFILLTFCIVKSGSKISVVTQTTILFSFATFFDLLATNKNYPIKSDKFQFIYQQLKQAKGLMEEEKEIEELY